MLLGTKQERITLLKSAMTGKQIEDEYVKLNEFKIVSRNVLRQEI
jgi:hypothetical protein